MQWKEQVLAQLPPPISRFVEHRLWELEIGGVCDAPGTISGVLYAMRVADSDSVRAHAAQTEAALIKAFSARRCQAVDV